MVHTWSIAVEFQFYVVSPLLIWAMTRPSSRHRLALAIPFSLAALSVLGRLAIVIANARRVAAAGYVENVYVWVVPELYTKTYVRCSPYMFGLAAAYCHKHGLAKPWLDSIGRGKYALDVAAAAVWCFITFEGPGGTTDQNIEGLTDIRAQYTLMVYTLLTIGRALFGLSCAWVVLVCVSGRGGPIAWILECKMWIPVAKLSYSACECRVARFLSCMDVTNLTNVFS